VARTLDAKWFQHVGNGFLLVHMYANVL
jgi:hypothetical protein